MIKKQKKDGSTTNLSRRQFLSALGTTTAGMLVAPRIIAKDIYRYGDAAQHTSLSQVALTPANTYDRTLIKHKVQHLFESIGGIQDIVKSGDKVAIKINLTGGSGSSWSSKLQGSSITESMWTHPEVLRAVGELLIDSGVSGNDLYIVEALWDSASFNNFGYAQVRQNLGAQLVDLNNKAPFADFIDLETGEKKFYYPSFRLNAILSQVDVYISIPKMKQHYEAGVTHSLKNQIGITPISLYKKSPGDGNRSKLHTEGGDVGIHLPRTICDLNLARPVHLAIIDGVKNAIGGEGVWNPTFQIAEHHILLAGKDAVATDSIASHLMGDDPEAERLRLPDGVRQADNHLVLLNQRGIGTNRLSEIEVVGDGAGLVTGIAAKVSDLSPDGYHLGQNFPNPFNPSTTIPFQLPYREKVTITLYNIAGEKMAILAEGIFPSGQHAIRWTAKNLPSGLYFYIMRSGAFVGTKKLVLRK
ncbi:DUF362 domain-containing protein [candidate division KSB1 bacterium]|nr:DUF362 domain-containing protein [candidate division KSB1 bacterium]